MEEAADEVVEAVVMVEEVIGAELDFEMELVVDVEIEDNLEVVELDFVDEVDGLALVELDVGVVFGGVVVPPIPIA